MNLHLHPGHFLIDLESIQKHIKIQVLVASVRVGKNMKLPAATSDLARDINTLSLVIFVIPIFVIPVLQVPLDTDEGPTH